MIKTTFKLILITLMATAVVSCGEDKKEETTTKVEEVKQKTRKELKEEEKAYYKDAIESVLNSTSDYAYAKSELGINTFIKGDEFICFLETKDETEAIYTDAFFANVYRANGKESLSFEFIDFEKEDINIEGVDYMLAAFNFDDVESTSSIQIGQYSKEQKKITWKVLIPKGRFHK